MTSAFPWIETDPTLGSRGESGMSLRDWFASTCPMTLAEFAPIYGMTLAEICKQPEHLKIFLMLFAECRYEYAEAMIQHRGSRE